MGSINGLRARGGFEIVSMQWQEAKLVKVIIKSILGGNLRLRVPNTIRFNDGRSLKSASGKNSNGFYHTEETPEPVIAPSAQISLPDLKETRLYDIPTQAGKLYTFVQ